MSVEDKQALASTFKKKALFAPFLFYPVQG